jgi:hypothetical protein
MRTSATWFEATKRTVASVLPLVLVVPVACTLRQKQPTAVVRHVAVGSATSARTVSSDCSASYQFDATGAVGCTSCPSLACN